MKTSLSLALGAGTAFAVIAGMIALRTPSEPPLTASLAVPEVPTGGPAAAIGEEVSSVETPPADAPAGSAFHRPPTTAFTPPLPPRPASTKPARAVVGAPTRAPRSELPAGPANFRVITHAPGDVEIELDDRATIPAVFASAAPPMTAPQPQDPAAAAGSEKIAAREDRIADDFIREVAAKPAGQPLTLEEYQDAAYVADERLRSLLGVEEYKARALRAAKEGLKKGSR
jgi:hypothetical protein